MGYDLSAHTDTLSASFALIQGRYADGTVTLSRILDPLACGVKASC